MAFDNCWWGDGSHAHSLQASVQVDFFGFELLAATVPPPAVNVCGRCRHTFVEEWEGFFSILHFSRFGRNVRTYEMAPEYLIVCNIMMGMISCDKL